MTVRAYRETIQVSSLGTNYTVAASPIQLVPAFGAANAPHPNALYRINVYRILLEGIAASTVQFQDNITGGTTTLISAQYSLAALGSLFLDIPINGDSWYQTRASAGLQLIVGGTGPVAGDVYYTLSP